MFGDFFLQHNPQSLGLTTSTLNLLTILSSGPGSAGMAHFHTRRWTGPLHGCLQLGARLGLDIPDAFTPMWAAQTQGLQAFLTRC